MNGGLDAPSQSDSGSRNPVHWQTNFRGNAAQHEDQMVKRLEKL